MDMESLHQDVGVLGVFLGRYLGIKESLLQNTFIIFCSKVMEEQNAFLSL